MTGEIKSKRKGGRPPLPAPPTDAAATRALIAQETVKTNPSERRLRYLYRLLKSFVAAEEAARMDLKNRIAREELELRKADYQLRFSKSPLAAKVIEQQRRRIAELEAKVRTLSASTIDCGTLDESDADLNSAKAGGRA